MGVLRYHQRDGRAVKRKFWVLAAVSFGSLFALSGHAQAQTTIIKPADGWEVYTTGRVGAFVEVLDGQGFPAATPGHTLTNEGVTAASDPANGVANQGHLFSSRVRSGFLGNILSLGVRRQMTESTTVTGQVSIWATAESDQQRTYEKEQADVREGYLKVQGPGGSLLVGRALSLFGRGATEIDFLYGHGFAVGAPSGFDTSGPSGGHIGYGVMANIFAAGVAYATPSLYGLQLSVGYYDPATIVGQIYQRTKSGRPEAEATFDANLGDVGKVHVFTDGAYQKLYDGTNGTTQSDSAYGAAAGARLELGPFHLGVAAYTGKGLGVAFFLNQDESITNQATAHFRTFDGGYVQTQLQIKKVCGLPTCGGLDFNVGAGITRAHQMTEDLDPMYPGQPDYLKSQMGISGVVVYHFTDYLHAAFDYFRSDVKWWLGEERVIHSFNAGMTLTW
jgi:hypothetical protein